MGDIRINGKNNYTSRTVWIITSIVHTNIIRIRTDLFIHKEQSEGYDREIFTNIV
jgi:hypothetical protein